MTSDYSRYFRECLASRWGEKCLSRPKSPLINVSKEELKKCFDNSSTLQDTSTMSPFLSHNFSYPSNSSNFPNNAIMESDVISEKQKSCDKSQWLWLFLLILLLVGMCIFVLWIYKVQKKSKNEEDLYQDNLEIDRSGKTNKKDSQNPLEKEKSGISNLFKNLFQKKSQIDK